MERKFESEDHSSACKKGKNQSVLGLKRSFSEMQVLNQDNSQLQSSDPLLNQVYNQISSLKTEDYQ